MTLSLPQKIRSKNLEIRIDLKKQIIMRTRYNNIQKLNNTTMIDCFNPSRNVAPKFDFGYKNKQVQTSRHLG